MFPGGSNASLKVRTWNFDNATTREVISHMLMVHELPFTLFKYDLFNVVMKEANPLFNKIYHASIREECISSYGIAKK